MRIRHRDIRWNIRNIMRKITGRKTLAQEREERMKNLMELLLRPDTTVFKTSTPEEFMSHLAKDFTVSSIVVAKKNGSIIASNEADAASSAARGSSLYDYISSHLPNTKYLLIKSEDKVYVVYPKEEVLYIVEASGEISSVEMKALARRATNVMKWQQE